MQVLSFEKMGRALKFSSISHHHHANSLTIFRSKVSDFITQILLKPEPEPEFLSLEHFSRCFEMIHVTNRAFSKLVLELDYPMSHWGAKASDECLNNTLILLDVLNSINSCVSCLNRARLSGLYKLSPIKIPVNFPKILNSAEIEKSPASEVKEGLILEALMLRKKIGLLSLGIMLSALCSDVKPYLEIREYAGGFNDPETKALDSKFIARMIEKEGFVKEVKAVNVAMDCAVSRESFKGCANEVKSMLEVLAESVNAIEKNANNLFYEVLAARNELMDHLRMAMN